MINIKNKTLCRLVNWVEGEETYPVEEKPVRETTVSVDASDRWRRNAERREKRLEARFREWGRENAMKEYRAWYPVVSTLVCAVVITVLLVTVSWLPRFGDPSNPANNEVPQRYIESGIEETGATNFVAGMILDYRAFDTLGESNVLFIAVCSVLILLRTDRTKGKANIKEMDKPAK